jgi:hypothetical protein
MLMGQAELDMMEQLSQVSAYGKKKGLSYD